MCSICDNMSKFWSINYVTSGISTPCRSLKKFINNDTFTIEFYISLIQIKGFNIVHFTRPFQIVFPASSCFSSSS